MVQDGLKVFNFTYGDEKEDPLPNTSFDIIRIGSNMRGLFTDLQIFDTYFEEPDLIAWTTKCDERKGHIY